MQDKETREAFEEPSMEHQKAFAEFCKTKGCAPHSLLAAQYAEPFFAGLAAQAPLLARVRELDAALLGQHEVNATQFEAMQQLRADLGTAVRIIQSFGGQKERIMEQLYDKDCPICAFNGKRVDDYVAEQLAHLAKYGEAK